MQLSVFAKLARKWGASGGHALEHAGMGIGMTKSARIAAIGDSTVAVDVDNANNIWGNSWVTYMVLGLAGNAILVGNFAVGGTQSSHALNTQLPQVLALNPRPTHCLIGTGTNDTDPIGQTKANVLAICAQLVAAGIMPIIRNMPPSGTAAIAPPTVTATPATTGGTLAAGTYAYRVSALNGVGETLAATQVTATTTGTTGSVTLTWAPVDGATGYKIYGRTSGAQLLIATNGNSGGNSRPICSYTDTGAVTPSGALPASNTTAVALTTTARNKITLGNAVLQQIARNAGYPFLDAYNYFVDTTSGMYQTGLTIDGTHATFKAYRQFGQDCASKLSKIFAVNPPYLAGDNSDPTVMLSNPLFLNNNGSVPSGWGPYGTPLATESITTADSGRGVAYQIAVTGYAGRYGGGPTINVGSGFAVGDRIRVSGFIKVTGADGLGGQASFGLRCTGGSVAWLFNLALNSDLVLTPFCFEAVVPAGVTALGLQTSTGYGPVTLKLENITVQNLTALGLV